MRGLKLLLANKGSCWKCSFIFGELHNALHVELGNAWGGDSDETDPEQAGGGFDAFCRGRGTTGTAMDGEVGDCSICPSPGDPLTVPAALLVFCWAEGAQVWGREDRLLPHLM